MRSRRDEYLSRFLLGHESTPVRLRSELEVAFAHHDGESLERAVLLVHGLQGTAAMLGLRAIHELGLALEQALDARHHTLGRMPPSQRAAVFAAVDLLQAMLMDVSREAPHAAAEVVSSLRKSG